MIYKLLACLRNLLTNQNFNGHDIYNYRDDSKHDFYYIILAKPSVDKNIVKYLNASMELSAQWLLDPVIAKSNDLECLWTVNDSTGDIQSHWIGYGRLKLPGIVNAIQYSLSDLETAVNQYMQNTVAGWHGYLPIGDGNDLEMEDEVTKPIMICDCGAHKCGYADTDLHGHGSWCKVHEVYSDKKN